MVVGIIIIVGAVLPQGCFIQLCDALTSSLDGRQQDWQRHRLIGFVVVLLLRLFNWHFISGNYLLKKKIKRGKKKAANIHTNTRQSASQFLLLASGSSYYYGYFRRLFSVVLLFYQCVSKNQCLTLQIDTSTVILEHHLLTPCRLNTFYAQKKRKVCRVEK